LEARLVSEFASEAWFPTEIASSYFMGSATRHWSDSDFDEDKESARKQLDSVYVAATHESWRFCYDIQFNRFYQTPTELRISEEEFPSYSTPVSLRSLL
jgi:hypothetical protein